jgi:hypothetical protein
LLLAAIAEAAPVKPPIGWVTDPAASVSMSKRLGEVPHFGGLNTSPITEVYRAPQGGASLFVTRLFAAAKPEERDRAVTIELAELDAAMKRTPDATSDLGGTRAIPDLKLLEGRRNWRDPSTGIVTHSRMVAAADDQQVVAVTGECVFAGDAAPDLITTCNAALASLDPIRGREPCRSTWSRCGRTGAIADPGAPGPLPTGQRCSKAASAPACRRCPSQQAATEQDRRPVYVGIGLVLLALIFTGTARTAKSSSAPTRPRARSRPTSRPMAMPTTCTPRRATKPAVVVRRKASRWSPTKPLLPPRPSRS